MKKPCSPIRVLCVFVSLLCAGTAAKADVFVTKRSQPGGDQWNLAIWSNAPNTIGTAPVAGNTYELVFNGTAWGNNTANSRIRNPIAVGMQTFVGDSLTLNTNTDIRMKTGGGAGLSTTILNFPGVSGNPGLILNGGILNPGDDIAFVVTGRIHVAGSGIFGDGDNGGGNEQRAFRAVRLQGILTGTGPITIVQGQPTNANIIATDSSGFSGNWIVQCGYLRGDGPNSLGSGSIFVTPTNGNAATIANNFALLELNYDINSPGTLVLSNHPTSGAPARMILHQNCTFSAIAINGTALSAGAHPYSELAANFPSNFASGGSGSLTVQPPAPPVAPTNVTAVSEDSKVTVLWNAPANAAGYSINRADVSGGPYTTVGNTAGNVTTFADATVVNGLTYYYVIVATNSLGASPNSPEAIGRPNPVVTGIVAIGGTNQVSISWSALVNATDYAVSRSTTSNGTYSVIASGITGTSYLDTTPQSGRTFWYRVSAALAGGGQSGQSAATSAVTAPGAPVVTTTLFASTVIRVGWTSDPVVTGFSVERSTDGVNFSPLATVGASPKSYTNSGLAANTTHYYRVQAINATGPSDYSAVVSNATPTVGYNVNFGSGGNASQDALNSPPPPGYLNDIGELFGDRTNGFFYGWTNAAGTNITRDTRWRQNALSFDLRYDTFVHLMKAGFATNPALSATWEMEIPNGFYSVHIVAGDPNTGDPNADRFQFNVEGALTPAQSANLNPFSARFADFTINVGVSDGRLTIRSGPLALNNKIAFVDIYPAVPVAPTITLNPANATVEQNRAVTLTAAASGSAVLQYQWYFNDSVVTNGTSSTLSFARPQPANSGNYYLVVTNYGGAITSLTATLTVNPDTTIPYIVSAGTLDGRTVGICFNEELDNSQGVVTEAGNYSINNNAITVLSATLRPDGRTVALRLQDPVTGTFTMGVFSQYDLAGNYLDFYETNVAVLGFSAADVGGPALAGSNFTCDNQTIEIVGGGADIWGTFDQGYLATRSTSGDFDARVRVTALAGSNAITKAVLVARETVNSNSAALHISVNPPAPGRNQIEMGLRPATDAATVAVGTSFIPAGVPNVWMRITRVGNLFTGYRSTDGVNWVQLGQTNVALAGSLAVGIGVTAHDNTLLATGTFSGLSISQTQPSAPLLYGATFSGGIFSSSFQSAAGISYEIQYSHSVGLSKPCIDFGPCPDPPVVEPWFTLTNIPGDGMLKTFSDPSPPPGRRFYRILTH